MIRCNYLSMHFKSESAVQLYNHLQVTTSVNLFRIEDFALKLQFILQLMAQQAIVKSKQSCKTRAASRTVGTRMTVRSREGWLTAAG